MAYESFMYRDPIESAMRAEEQRCTGCKSLTKLFDREFCGIGRRELKKCKKFTKRDANAIQRPIP